MQAPAGESVTINPSNDWHRKPSISVYAPRGDAIPSWWQYSRPTWLYDSLSWYAAMEAEGNAATNTRVQVKNIRMYMLSQSTRKWTLVNKVDAPWTDVFAVQGAVYQGTQDFRNESGGGVSVKPKYPNFEHGYGTAYTMSNPSDVRAVFTAIDFRLVVDNPGLPDDRAKARYVVSASGDYWPGKGQASDWPWAPAMANGRFLLAKNEWRTATMIVPNPNYGSTFEELRNNPPPLN
jgi:hypothetical protein